MEIVILALPRTGSSLLAGMLHDSGVSMGEMFQQGNKHNPGGFYEDIKLKQAIKYKHNRHLTDYIRYRNRQDDKWGMKDPEMCGRLHEIEDSFDNLHVIDIHRPLVDSIKSLKKYFHQPEKTVKDLSKGKKKDLKEIDAPVHSLSFYDLVENPEEEYKKICDFISIEPNMEVTERVDSNLVHHCVNM